MPSLVSYDCNPDSILYSCIYCTAYSPKHVVCCFSFINSNQARTFSISDGIVHFFFLASFLVGLSVVINLMLVMMSNLSVSRFLG